MDSSPPKKKLKVEGSNPYLSPPRCRSNFWNIYVIRRRIVFDEVTPEGVQVGSLLAVPGTPDHGNPMQLPLEQ